MASWASSREPSRRWRAHEWPGNVAREVVDAYHDVLEERLRALGLLHDDRLRWCASGVGWALFWIGLGWATASVLAHHGVPPDGLAWLVVVAAAALLGLMLRALPEAGGKSDTCDGRKVVAEARARRPAVSAPTSAHDLLLGVALHGMCVLEHSAERVPGPRPTISAPASPKRATSVTTLNMSTSTRGDRPSHARR